MVIKMKDIHIGIHIVNIIKPSHTEIQEEPGEIQAETGEVVNTQVNIQVEGGVVEAGAGVLVVVV